MTTLQRMVLVAVPSQPSYVTVLGLISPLQRTATAIDATLQRLLAAHLVVKYSGGWGRSAAGDAEMARWNARKAACPPPSRRPARRLPGHVQLQVALDLGGLRSDAYLAYVRRHACCICGAAPPSAIYFEGLRWVADDLCVVPLCSPHHEQRRGDRWTDLCRALVGLGSGHVHDGRRCEARVRWCLVRTQFEALRAWIRACAKGLPKSSAGEPPQLR